MLNVFFIYCCSSSHLDASLASPQFLPCWIFCELVMLHLLILNQVLVSNDIIITSSTDSYFTSTWWFAALSQSPWFPFHSCSVQTADKLLQLVEIQAPQHEWPTGKVVNKPLPLRKTVQESKQQLNTQTPCWVIIKELRLSSHSSAHSHNVQQKMPHIIDVLHFKTSSYPLFHKRLVLPNLDKAGMN